MDKNILDYLNLIKESIHRNDITDKYDYSDTDWVEITKLAAGTGMLGIVFKRMKDLAVTDEKLKEIVLDMERRIFIRGISEIRKNQLLAVILKIASEEQLPVLLFKGVVLSSLYPEPSMRFSSDTDMYIDECYRNKMADIFVRLGYEYKEESNENVVKYSLPQQHYIELHSKLWSVVTGNKIDILEKMKLTEKRIHATFDGVECDTIDYGEQLIFLMFHLYKHLFFEHANIRFLTDIMLFFYAHCKEMDLQLAKDRMLSLDYWNFFSLLYEISVRFLGFERLPEMEALGPEMYDAQAAEITINELMLLYKDDFDEKHHFQLMYNMMPYLTGDSKEIEKSWKKQKRMHYLFPGVEDFPEEYKYVKKYPILLPIGWIHRIIKYAFDRLFHKESRISGVIRMNKVEDKVERLEKMGLINDLPTKK